MGLPEKYGIDKNINSMANFGFFENGGKGSGNFGHAGRPGEVGGSAPEGSTPSVESGVEDKKPSKRIRHGSYIDGVIGAKILDQSSREKKVESRVPKEILRDTVADAATISNLHSKESDYKGVGDADKSALQSQDYVAGRIARAYEEMIYEMLATDTTYSGITPYYRTEQVMSDLKDTMSTYDDYMVGVKKTKSAVSGKLSKRDKVIRESYSKLQDHLKDFATKGYDYYKEVVDLTDLIENSVDGSFKNGGKGSGNFGHAGRPGEVGGSGDGGKIDVGKDKEVSENLKKAIEKVKKSSGEDLTSAHKELQDLLSKLSPKYKRAIKEEKEVYEYAKTDKDFPLESYIRRIDEDQYLAAQRVYKKYGIDTDQY